MNARDRHAIQAPALQGALTEEPRSPAPRHRAVREPSWGAQDAATWLRSVTQVATGHANAARRSAAGLLAQQAQAARSIAGALARQSSNDAIEYLVDAFQRGVLFMDILRRRGNSFARQEREGSRPVLVYEYDTVVDGATLERPVNYSLVAIRPPAGTRVRPDARPYIIIDPRAGHGSGIGGFKNESEVGVALHGGHPVYFCIFTTHPTPTQTLADVTRAEAHFVREVQRRHPTSAKPVVIGNCQGGWAAVLLAATNPDLTGPLVVNGAPLSYWAGTRGKNPMRYSGGLLGGVTPAMLACDLGNGQFDGAHLVANFEGLNPGNSLWSKYYDVFADPEGQAERYLEFERWWSGFYFMNEAEMRWIVENLFIGNRLARGGAQLDSRMHVDLRNIRAPIILFASHGDNITPPAQALNWIPDVYSSVKDIQARGQRIVYTVHESVGHLGIFVSSSVAMKEHKEIVSTLKAIEALAPGLYEMRIVDESGEGVDKRFAVTFEDRDIRDILAMDDGRDDEGAFAAVDRLSRLGSEVYALTMRPFVRAFSNAATARWQVDNQPIRASRYLLSDNNPWIAPIASAAQAVRGQRAPAKPENPYRMAESTQAQLVTAWLDAARDLRDGWVETWFYSVFGSPAMRAVGATEAPRISDVAGSDLRTVPEVRSALAQMTRGNLAVAVIRMLLLLAQSRQSVRRDRLERANAVLTQQEPFASLGEETRTRIIHQQNLIVEFEPERAMATLPALIPDPKDRPRALEICEYVVGGAEEMAPETRAVFVRLREALDVRNVVPARPSRRRIAA